MKENQELELKIKDCEENTNKIKENINEQKIIKKHIFSRLKMKGLEPYSLIMVPQ